MLYYDLGNTVCNQGSIKTLKKTLFKAISHYSPCIEYTVYYICYIDSIFTEGRRISRYKKHFIRRFFLLLYSSYRFFSFMNAPDGVQHGCTCQGCVTHNNVTLDRPWIKAWQKRAVEVLGQWPNGASSGFLAGHPVQEMTPFFWSRNALSLL